MRKGICTVGRCRPAGHRWPGRLRQRRPAARHPPRKTPKIGVILPDSKSSARWETADRKYLEAAFKAAGVEYDIQNAQGDKTAVPDHRRPDDHRAASTVLMIVNLDSGTGKAVLDKAKAAGRRRPSTTTA